MNYHKCGIAIFILQKRKLSLGVQVHVQLHRAFLLCQDRVKSSANANQCLIWKSGFKLPSCTLCTISYLHSLFFQKWFYLFIYLLERGREGETEGEKHQCVVASHAPPPQPEDLPCNPGMCPNLKSNRQPFGSQAGNQSTEPYQPGNLPSFWRLGICAAHANISHLLGGCMDTSVVPMLVSGEQSTRRGPIWSIYNFHFSCSSRPLPANGHLHRLLEGLCKI